MLSVGLHFILQYSTCTYNVITQENTGNIRKRHGLKGWLIMISLF